MTFAAWRKKQKLFVIRKRENLHLHSCFWLLFCNQKNVQSQMKTKLIILACLSRYIPTPFKHDMAINLLQKTESKQIVVVEYIYYFLSFHSIHSFLAGIYYTVYNNQLVKVLFMFSENLQIKMIVHVQFALKYYPCNSR